MGFRKMEKAGDYIINELCPSLVFGTIAIITTVWSDVAVAEQGAVHEIRLGYQC